MKIKKYEIMGKYLKLHIEFWYFGTSILKIWLGISFLNYK